MAVSSRTKDYVRARFSSARIEATTTDDYKEWSRNVEAASKYMQGKQYSESMRSDSNNPIITAPLIADLVDQTASFIDGSISGKYRVQLTARNDAGRMLRQTVLELYQALQDKVNLNGWVHEATRDQVSCGAGVLRGYIDKTKIERFGEEIALQRVLPGSWWINPVARNPYDPVYGSDYFCSEAPARKRQLVRRYPHLKNAIRSLSGARRGYQVVDKDDENDPLYNYIRSLEAADAQAWTIFDDVSSEDYNKDDEEFVREAEFYWMEEVPSDDPDMAEMGVVKEKWYRAAFAIPAGTQYVQGNSIVLLEAHPVPYRKPPISIITNWVRNDSAYPLGIVSRTGDLQDMLDYMLSLLMRTAQIASKYSNVIIARNDDIDPATADDLESSEPSGLIRLGNMRSRNVPIDQMFSQLKTSMPNFGEFESIMSRVDGLIQRVSGVSAIASGHVGASQRISGQGIAQLQERAFASQTTSRMHLNYGITHIGNTLLDMIQVHWSEPFSMSDMGIDNDGMVNRLIQPERAGVVDDLVNMEKPEIDGRLAVPNSVRIVTEDDEEIAEPLDFRDEDAAIRRLAELDEDPTVKSWEIGINDIVAGAIEFGLKIEIDLEHQQRVRELVEATTLLTQQYGEPFIAKKMMWNLLFSNHPEMDWELNQEEQGVEQMSDAIGSLSQQGQQAAMQAIQQIIAAEQQPQAQGANPAVQSQGQVAPGQLPPGAPVGADVLA